MQQIQTIIDMIALIISTYGRRRPFILVGQTICAISLLITYFTVHKAAEDKAAGKTGGEHTLLLLLITSQVIGSFGGNLEGPAWGAPVHSADGPIKVLKWSSKVAIGTAEHSEFSLILARLVAHPL